MNKERPQVIIIGAGFGGLFAARALAGKAVDVLLIDRNNFHTFTPLIYQVATCALDPSEVAYPVRTIFRKDKNIRFLLGNVTAIDKEGQTVTVNENGEAHSIDYDFLIVASGSTPTFFGNDTFAQNSLVLRTLSDAVDLRNHVLQNFEKAAWSDSQSEVEELTTIVVVGGGPTGIETAGAIFELYNHVLNAEYRGDSLRARVVLVEMQPHLLAPYPDSLRQAALKQLRSLGVEVLLENPIEKIGETLVRLGDGTEIPTQTLVWAAGVKASPLAEMLNVPLQRGGRVPIEPTTAVIDHPNLFAVGDIAYLEDPDGQPYPMLIPVAQQQGVLAAENILATLEEKERVSFDYHDRGIMATIGRRRAVAYIYNKIALTGFLAWLAWLALHLITLMGFRNRMSVFINWMWNYFTYDRSARIILEKAETKKHIEASSSLQSNV